MPSPAILSPVILTLLLLFSAVLLPPAVAQATGSEASQQLTLGMFAYRPREILEPRFQPLADYLSEQLDGVEVVLEVLDQDAIEAAMAQQRLDMLFTNPSHYVQVRSQNPLTGALATLISMEDGQPTDHLGGVIIARHDAPPISHLQQLRGSRIGVPGVRFLGGYQTQAYELQQVGLRLPRDAEQIEIGSHDAVVKAVLAGEVDFGFIRTGVIEAMSQEGSLQATQLQIINAQHLEHFPYYVSTRLYPEWAFVALPHLEQRTVRKIASSLMGLAEDHPVAQAAGIGGFSPPGDYLPVENLARALRMPPFDERVPLEIFWEDHRTLAKILILLFLAALGWAILFSLRIRRQRRRSAMALRESAEIIEHSPLIAIRWANQSNWPVEHVSGNIERFGYTREALLAAQFSYAGLIHPDDYPTLARLTREHIEQGPDNFRTEYRLRHGDGHWIWVDSRTWLGRDAQGRVVDIRGVLSDITERKRHVDQLRQAASVFEHANEGIMITDNEANILDVNAAFTRITGYQREEVLGKNPRLLRSGHHDASFYTAMWHALNKYGHWSGELWNRHKSGEVYAELLTISTIQDAQGKIQRYIGLFADITQLKHQQKQLEYMAHYDALTGLPNRVLLADRLHQAMVQAKRHHHMVAVVYLDLDGFKTVNDTHGHDMGDLLLIRLAEQMKLALRDEDTLARLGGDEFVAVLLDLPSVEASLPVLERLLHTSAEALTIKERVLRVSASIGVSFYPQEEDLDADQLLRQADQAMYQAKQSGKNRYHIFDTEHDQAVRGQHESLERIREALAKDEFVLYYQPKVNMRSGEVIGAEALIRWQHPERGLLPPAAFLPVLEHHPLAIEVGEWVMVTALDQIEAWRQAGIALPVSINIDALHLQQPNFIEHLREALAAHPSVRPGDLELEILETSALEDITGVSTIIEACRKLGVGFSLDDFGTGYSSLTYLKRLPAQLLKIDQSFVRDMLEDPDDLAILDGIVGLADAFQRLVIAEGVETQAHSEMLLRLGCELGQGYAIGKPMPTTAIPDWLKGWQPSHICRNLQPVHQRDLPILFAMVEHRAWVSALEHFLYDKQPSPPPMDAHDCRFGQWLARQQAGRQQIAPALARLQALHQQLHQQAAELLALKYQGSSAEAQAGMESIRQIHIKLLEQLQALLDIDE